MAENFLTQLLPPGIGGLDLKHPVDLVQPARLTRMTNLVRNEEGALTSRPGQAEVGTAGSGAEIHSIIRVNHASGFDRILGVGTELYCGTTGPFTLIDSGYSGNPLGMLTYHPPISGDSWAYIADSQRMRKVRASDCLDLEIGLGSPPASDTRFRIDEFKRTPDGTIGSRDRTRLTSVGFDITGASGGGQPGDLTAYATQGKTIVDTCDTAGWTNNNGSGGAVTNVVDNTDFKEGTGSVKFLTNNGAAAGAYFNFWAKANAKDLNAVGGVAATDDDIIHLWLKCDRPDVLIEARLYFVLNSSFAANTVPGTSDTANTDAYYKAFRGSDFTAIYEVSSGTISGATTANTNLSTLDQLPTTGDTRGSTENIRQQRERSRRASLELAPGRGQWTEFGVVGVALHRRDFARIGSDTTRNWGTVTGLVLVAQMGSNADINIWLDDVYLTGGAGPDTSLVGMSPYDYRYIHYDPRTGAKSNPSPIQGAGFRLDSLRQGIVVSPKTFGDAAVRQRFFRRGGTLNNAWFFLGENTADGASFTDTKSDLEILLAGLLEEDNDQPVTTVDSAGNAVRAQAVPAIWGPVTDLLFACGDPNRKGHVYWSKPTQADSWPAAHNVEVCAPSEELMNGCVFAGQSYVFSRERMYSLVPQLENAGIVSSFPTECDKGLLARSGLCVAYGAIHFVSKDGIYRTTGGAPECISDELLRPLFHGESKNGYLPVDFTVPAAIHLEAHDNEIWFQYQDSGGTRRTLIWSTLYQFWRQYQFGREVAGIHSEKGTTSSLLLGGRTTGKLYSHSGTSDDGLAIAASGRTGAWDQGLPREDKLYGDIPVDATRNDTTITITPHLNNETTTLIPLTITTGSGYQRYYLDTKNATSDPVQGRNIALDFAWSTTGTSPILYKIGPSYTPQPDTSELRVTNWDNQGRLSDKYIKGILLECDTGGVDKVIELQADGVTGATITVNANSRRVLEFSFPQFLGRLLRLNPTTTVPWKLYQARWIFDEEPLALSRWETQEINHGIPGSQYPLYCYLTYKASAQVDVSVTAYRQDGSSLVKNYSFASTGGVKQQTFWKFEPQKGVLFKWVFTSSAPFWLFRPESPLIIRPWVGDAQVVFPFGDDDLDKVRGLSDAGLAAGRSGGGG